MEGNIDVDAPLEYAGFQISSSQNRYDAFVCCNGKRETLASGHLEHLVLHLPEAKGFHSDQLSENFKLQLPENLRGSSWFTKSTLARFLHIIGAPELLNSVNAIADEMSQLEEARRFHIALYTQGHRDHSGSGTTDNSYSKEVGPTMQPKVQTPSSDATKNELLRAMDLRLTASRQELVTAFNHAAGATCSTEQIAYLSTFAQHFGAAEIRNSLFKYISLSQKNQTADSTNEQSHFSRESRNDSGKLTEGLAQAGLSVKTAKSNNSGISPVKIAQAERQSSTESEESSNSGDEDQSFAERSRPLIRSTSSRRSASPMRRVQIGRAGSRRPAAVTIKSLTFFPARERISSNRDAPGNSSGDEESDQPSRKPENPGRRMSVQDAINLFESKQRDQNSDLQKRRSLVEASVSTNKSVLRRWSAGSMGDSSTHCPPENAPESVFQAAPDNSEFVEFQNNSIDVKPKSDILADSPIPVKTAEVGASLAKEESTSSTDCPTNLVTVNDEESHDRATDSAEWNRQKEAELNQMLMKIINMKPAKGRITTTGSGGKKEFSGEQRGGFYDHYKEKRDEKLRRENAGKRAEKEAQFKAMQAVLDQRKAEMASKNAGTGKNDSIIKPQRARRNSSPPVLPKRETTKSASSKKVPAKASPLPATRKSWPSTPSPKTNGMPTTKISSGIRSTSTTPNRRSPQPASTRSSPQMGKSQQPQKGMKGAHTESNQSLKDQEEKKQPVIKKNGKSTKTKASVVSGDDSGIVPAKPSFYNKVTKKGSVVPLESKPFLRKGTGIGPGVGPVVIKTKVSQSDDSSRNSGTLIPAQEKEVVTGTAETMTQLHSEQLDISVNDDANLEISLDNNPQLTSAENSDQFVTESGDNFAKTEACNIEIQAEEEDCGISSAAWVEIDNQELPVSDAHEISIVDDVAPVASSSPRVRHSLSQMLQADSGEPEIIEWGNAENPPALVYQKDAPKGLKRLLKFARKSKGDANLTGWASPSVFSEGEEDSEEAKAASKRNAGIQANGLGQQNTMLRESYDSGNSSKRAMDYMASHELLSVQSNSSNFLGQGSHKLREGHISAAGVSTKATRSFFSLSTFRSSKSTEGKLR